MNSGEPAESLTQAQRWRETAGDAWARFHVEIDATFAPFNDALIDAATPKTNERVLDVGCGCGGTSLALAARVAPHGSVIGLDLSPAQLAVARERAAASKLAIEFRQDDAATWRADAPFDLIASRLGFMFFADPVAAFVHLRGQAPGGRAALLCWAEAEANPWMRLGRESAQGLLDLPAEPPAGSPGPFGFDDRDRLFRVLTESGWRSVEIARFDTTIAPAGGAPADVLRLSMKLGPSAPAIAAADEPTRAGVREAMAARIAAWTSGGRVTAPASAWIATARS
ncbi:MAG: Methyltransferase type 11 [Rhodospirillales bacterium]|nr:Methyltransferase type 11 [Rhodospirillales bacterium]